jgi:hypothetical protein
MFIFENLLQAIAMLINTVLSLYFWIVIISALLSWVNPDPYNPIIRDDDPACPLFIPFFTIMPTQYPKYIQQVGPHAWKLCIWVQPRAKKSGIQGLYGDRLKIKVTAPPVDHKANGEVVETIASLLGIKNREVRVHSGETGRKKDLVIETEDEPCWEKLVDFVS